MPHFNAAQSQALVAAFDNTQPPSSRLSGKSTILPWIIDTGFFHHVIGIFDCLLDVVDVSPCPVDLPDGTYVMATQEGSVRLSNNITLLHVLFVPQLNCNLISVSHLIDKLNFCVNLHITFVLFKTFARGR